ncbi:Peroxisomal targeting signal 1 receptor [Lamellibrachia satsuma]|nr:Peroxisomal targeting signal 1 receptor [Lamellibrachia satsuma]
MAMRNLVDPECGGTNPLMKLTSHFMQDKSHLQDGLRRERLAVQMARPFIETTEEDLVNEFLSEQKQNLAPATFNMNSLLKEMQEIEDVRMREAPQRAPAVADLATSGSTWAAEYLEAESGDRRKDTGDWTEELTNGGGYPPTGAVSALQPAPSLLLHDTKWAQEYLVESDAKPWPEEFETSLTDNIAWVQGEKQDDLAATAGSLLDCVDDPKFANTEFMRFLRQISEGEVLIEDNEVRPQTAAADARADAWVKEFTGPSLQERESLVDKWAEEFASRDDKDQVLEADIDYWDKLQRQWDDISQ